MKKVRHIHRWSNWWKVKADSSMERLCLNCGEIRRVAQKTADEYGNTKKITQVKVIIL